MAICKSSQIWTRRALKWPLSNWSSPNRKDRSKGHSPVVFRKCSNLITTNQEFRISTKRISLCTRTKLKTSQTATATNIKMQLTMAVSASKYWQLLQGTKLTALMTSHQARTLVLETLLTMHNCIRITRSTKSWHKPRPNNRVKRAHRQAAAQVINIIDQWTRVIKTNWPFRNKFNNCRNSKWVSSLLSRISYKELLPTSFRAVQEQQLLVIRPRNKSSTTIWKRNFWQSTKRCRRKDKEATWIC